MAIGSGLGPFCLKGGPEQSRGPFRCACFQAILALGFVAREAECSSRRPWEAILESSAMFERLSPPWLNRDLRLLFVQRALRSLTQAYLIVIVPIYLARLGFSAVQLGLLFAAASLWSAILTAAVGLLADRYGRKPLLFLNALLTAAGAAIFVFSTNYVVLLVAGALSTLGRGGGAGSGGAFGSYYPAEQALIAEKAIDRERTAVLGSLSFVGILAGAFGSLLALVPSGLRSLRGLSLQEGDRLLFGLTAILGLVMAVVILPVHEARPRRRPARGLAMFRLPLSPRTRSVVWRSAVTNLTNGLAVGFLGPFIVYSFLVRFGAGGAEQGLLFFFINVSAAVANLFAARLALRLGEVNAVVTTRLMSVLLLATLPLMPTFTLAAVLYLLRSIANSISVPIRQSYLMGVVEPAERASAAGLSSLPSQVAMSFTPTLAGYAIEMISLAAPLELAAALQAINAVLYYLLFRGIKPPEEMGPPGVGGEES